MCVCVRADVCGARQIENEYGNVDAAYGAPGKAYMRWAAGMAVALDTGVPWVMCQQDDAPDPLVCGHSLPGLNSHLLVVIERNGMECPDLTSEHTRAR